MKCLVKGRIELFLIFFGRAGTFSLIFVVLLCGCAGGDSKTFGRPVVSVGTPCLEEGGCEIVFIYTPYDCKLCIKSTLYWIKNNYPNIPFCVARYGKKSFNDMKAVFELIDNKKYFLNCSENDVNEIVNDFKAEKFPVLLERKGKSWKVILQNDMS